MYFSRSGNAMVQSCMRFASFEEAPVFYPIWIDRAGLRMTADCAIQPHPSDDIGTRNSVEHGY